MRPRRFRRFRPPWRSRALIARQVDDELAFHLAMRVDELVAAGVRRDEAERQAREEFGDLDFTRAYCLTMDERTDRAARLTDRLGAVWQDLRYAARTLRRAPSFTIVSLATLALAIGANTAVFSVARAVLLAPLPYGNPDALFTLFAPPAQNPTAHMPLSPPNFADVRTQQRTLTGVAAYYWHSVTWLPASGDAELLAAASVTPDLFDVLHVPALYGHTFVPGDDAPGRDAKAVLSYAFWRRAFAGDAAVVGRTMTLGGRRYDVVGVMPRGFTLGDDEALWVPLDLSEDLANPERTRKQHYLQAVARVRPGVTIDAARADVQAIARRLAAAYPDANSDRGAALVPMRDVLSGDLRPALWLLQGAAAMVLLIACANLMNLTLSRTTARRREIALRAAIGSGRGRLVRQLLAESLLLAAAGGGIGVVIAAVGTRRLLALNPNTLPAMFGASVDWRVVLFSVALSLVAGTLFGLVPARSAARSGLHDALKEGARGSSGGRGGERVRRALVVAQVGLAVMLLAGAGLLVRSFGALTRVPLGFTSERVLTAHVRASGARYDSAAAVNRLFDGVLEEIATTPGVVAAGAASLLPTEGNQSAGLRVEGEPVDEAHLPDIRYVAVRGDFLKAMRVPLVAGRAYGPADDAGPKTALVNQEAARRYFPRGDAVGRRIRIGPDPTSDPLTIVGVVADVRDDGPAASVVPTMYANHRRETWMRELSIAVRTSGDPSTAAAALRSAVKRADPTLALRDVRSLDDVLRASLAPRRFALGLVSCFAALAASLAAIGIYGVLSYAVASRTREIGVRLALGATARSVLLLVVRDGLAWAALGLIVGIAAALAGGRLLAGMLFGVRATDPTTFGAVTVGVLAVVLLACLAPAARAMRVDPLASVRAE